MKNRARPGFFPRPIVRDRTCDYRFHAGKSAAGVTSLGHGRENSGVAVHESGSRIVAPCFPMTTNRKEGLRVRHVLSRHDRLAVLLA